MKFLSKVLTTFDDTKVLAAKVGQYALIAKQKGDEWYVGGMTNWTARDMEVDFSFLPKGVQYTAEIYKDGTDANLYADQYIYETKTVDNTTKMTIPLAAGGGTVMRIHSK